MQNRKMMRALRCPRCDKLLGKALNGGRIEIKCPPLRPSSRIPLIRTPVSVF